MTDSMSSKSPPISMHSEKASKQAGSSQASNVDASPQKLDKLEGSWALVGKTERRDESGVLEIGMNAKEPVLKFGSTILYLSPEPVSCDELCGETRYSFEVTDAASVSETDGSTNSETFGYSVDSNGECSGEIPGAFDVCLKADGQIEGDATVPGAAATDDICYKFQGRKRSDAS